MALTVIAAVALLVLGALEAVRGMVMTRTGTWIDRLLAADALQHSAARIRSAGAGPSAQGLRDLASIRTYLGSPAVFAIFDAPFVPLFIGVIFLIHATLGWIAIGGAIVLFGFALANEFVTRRPVAEANAKSAMAMNEADAALRNADVIEALGMMDALKNRWQAASDQYLGSYMRASDRVSLIGATARVIRLGLQVAMLGVGAWLVTQDALTGGAMIAASIIAGRALAPLEQSINGWKVLVGAQESYRRVKALLQGDAGSEGNITLPQPRGRLSVEGLIFIPPGSTEPILRDISFALEPGSSVGLIGPSAAGKTTLVRHLVGSLIPTRGHVRLDGADLSYWNAADRGRAIGYLPQDVELFAGTVRDNISRLGEATDEQVIEAARIAGAHEAILALPKGYDTEVDPIRGVLSGGQRQRVALARAVFGRPKLVVLDEPNANLDSDGEQALVQALKELKKLGTTVVMVAHRPSLMSSMDQLLMIRFGSVIAFGDREEILGNLAAPIGVGGGRPAAKGDARA
jgi:ATP-binding cassette subfamily C protein/ATP-binding cassette subfamily C protein EexD